MITDLLWNVVYTVLHVIFDVLPTASLANVFGTVFDGAQSLGATLGAWNTILPASEISWAIYIITSIFFPAIVVYKIANWVWRHIPDLGGFGPGAG